MIMWRYFLEVNLCWAVFYLLYHFWLQRETFFSANRWYLLGTLLTGLAIPLIQLPLATTTEPLAIVLQAPVVVVSDWLEVTVVPEQKASAGFSIWGWAPWIYWTGLALALGRFLYGLGQIMVLYKDAEVISHPGFKLVLTRKAHLPFSFFHFLFQSKEFPLETAEEEQIYRHELAHIHGWHSLDVLLIEFLGMVFWCSPLIYLYRRSLRDIHEYLADSAVLRTTRRKQYSQLLIRQFQSGQQIALANHFIRSQFKKRIMMMTRKRSRRGASLKYLLILPALALALVMFAKRTELISGLNWSGLEMPDERQFTPDTTGPIKSSWVRKQDEKYQIHFDTTRKIAEIMPRFPGCEELATTAEVEFCAQKKFLEYIYKAITYPAAARKAGLQGTVIAGFIIDEEGNLKNPVIKRDVGGGLGEEVIRLLKEMPQWIPGQDQGKTVAVEMTLPVKFALESTQKETKPMEQYDVMPAFAGCAGEKNAAALDTCTGQKFKKFMSDNLRYPAQAKESGIEGKVIVQITLDEQGRISEAEVVRSVGGGLDEEALRVVKMMPAWTPAQKGGKAVKALLTLPINFDLPIEHKVVVIGYGYPPAPQADELPRFPGCEDISDDKERKACAQKRLLEYVFKELRYPKEAVEQGLDGVVVAEFEVLENGMIGEVRILKSPGSMLDQEVERVLKTMNGMSERWTPGRKEGKVVKSVVTLPVKFTPEKEGKALDKKELATPPLELQDFRLTPNPNQGDFALSFRAEAAPTRIRITDAAGKVVYEESLRQFDGQYEASIQLSQQVKGSYFLYVLQEGKGQFSRTFLIQ